MDQHGVILDKMHGIAEGTVKGVACVYDKIQIVHADALDKCKTLNLSNMMYFSKNWKKNKFMLLIINRYLHYSYH